MGYNVKITKIMNKEMEETSLEENRKRRHWKKGKTIEKSGGLCRPTGSLTNSNKEKEASE